MLSLDVFRGLTIALMVVVNDAGGRVSYAPLNHSAWNGWTLTDTVFPSFLWIVGVAITLSLGKRVTAGASRRELLPGIVRRAAILFLFGMAIYAFPHFDLGTQRILGVLQRIAICYLIASLIFLYSGIRSQVLWTVGLLAAYWLMMKLIPVPGYGAGHLDMEGNFAHYIDRIVLGHHNYASTHSWDPEGLVSTLPAIATTLLGVLAGHILRLKESITERTVRFFLAGNLLVAAGYICSIWLPINKKLWTDSFTLLMAGLNFVVMAILLWTLDIRRWTWAARPFAIFGMNAITVYLASEFLNEALQAIKWHNVSLQQVLYITLFAPLASPPNASLLYAIAFTLCMYTLAHFMYKRGWFLRV